MTTTSPPEAPVTSRAAQLLRHRQFSAKAATAKREGWSDLFVFYKNESEAASLAVKILDFFEKNPDLPEINRQELCDLILKGGK